MRNLSKMCNMTRAENVWFWNVLFLFQWGQVIVHAHSLAHPLRTLPWRPRPQISFLLLNLISFSLPSPRANHQHLAFLPITVQRLRQSGPPALHVMLAEHVFQPISYKRHPRAYTRKGTQSFHYLSWQDWMSFGHGPLCGRKKQRVTRVTSGFHDY